MQAGVINHALRFTAVNSRKSYVWPARHFASTNTNPNVPPLGTRFRLKSSVDLSGMSPAGKIIMQAMKDYGIILADNGSNWYVSGAPNPNWDDNALHNDFAQIKGNMFEAVDCSSLQIGPDTGAAN